jgi:hypothetical protein
MDPAVLISSCMCMLCTALVIALIVWSSMSRNNNISNNLDPPQWKPVGAAQDGTFIINKINELGSGGTYIIPNGVWQIPSTITIGSKSNLTIQGSGDTIIYGPSISSQIVLLDTCTGITLKNMTLMRGPVPPFYQTRVLAIQGNNLDVETLPGYRNDLENTPLANQPAMVFSGEQIKPDSPDVYVSSVSKTSENKFRVVCASAPNAVVGDYIVFRCAIKEDLALWNCSKCVLDTVIFSNCSGFVVLENGGDGGHVYDKVKIIRGFLPAGATVNCLLAANADAFHSSNTRVGPTIRQCYVERVGDDCLNVHGRMAKIVSVMGNNVTVSITEPQGLTTTGEITILNDKGTFMRRTKAIRNGDVLTLDSPEGVMIGGMIESNDKCGNGTNVMNCKFVENRARGLFFKCWDVKCLDNVIIGATICGIAVCPEPSWGESGFSRNVDIRRNVIQRVGYATAVDGAQELVGAISVTSPYPELPGKQGHENVLIEGNNITETKGVLIYISHVESGSVRNNTLNYIGTSTRGSSRSNTDKAIVISPNSKIQIA